jgi:hypothetical protein
VLAAFLQYTGYGVEEFPPVWAEYPLGKGVLGKRVPRYHQALLDSAFRHLLKGTVTVDHEVFFPESLGK